MTYLEKMKIVDYLKDTSDGLFIVYDENGDFTYSNNTSNPPVGNPVDDAYNTEQKRTSTRILGNLFE